MGGSESKGREENGETKESSDTALAKESIATTLAKGAIAGVAIGVVILALGMGVVSLMGDSSKSSEEKTMEDPLKEEKTMKAPGRSRRIARDDFERDPAAYFSGLRRDKQKEKSLATK
ncbi:uncharacterized protein LOC125315605 isoform X1 [Rhodamnia argentea]|uniref:Uncharacterized protein LOC125315605 isoform X1 n=1 Tax=Rhodamnia argentea TaxID=178133 RepID=A0ABM3HK33_9MYRT|nr:uncharacterized protein LOC125315605 isoform X1 [Rhodamnia argentea]XP_048136950.1 uncharacterized protein LOC125315605 isoform X1 [Rhodamnia argentea]